MGERKKEELSLVAKIRFAFHANLYGAIFVYSSFWTIIKHFLVLLASAFGVEETREELLEQVETGIKKKFEIPEEHRVVVGETARSLFYSFLLSLDVKEDEFIILTPLQHYSFPRIFKAMNLNVITVDQKPDGTGWDWDMLFNNITPEQARKCRACVVTHMYGFNQKYEEMVEWCWKNDVLIFEDCIQGYTMFQYLGHPRAHMSVYSGGMDKIPCTTKGGFGIVRHNLDIYHNVTNVINNFPSQTWSKRLSDLISQFLYWFLTTTKVGIFFVVCLGLSKGISTLWEQTHFIRKNFLKAYVGKFTVDRVSYRPSIYHLKAMVLGVQRSQRFQVDMLHESRAAFREMLGEKYSKILFPWKDGGDWLDDHANLYWHCLARERDTLLDTMSDNGWAMCYQQAWDCCPQYPGFPEPVHAQMLKENMAYLPLMHQMEVSEMQKCCELVKGHLDKYHADGKPLTVEKKEF